MLTGLLIELGVILLIWAYIELALDQSRRGGK